MSFVLGSPGLVLMRWGEGKKRICGLWGICGLRKGSEQAEAEMPTRSPAARPPASVLPLLHISWHFPVISPAGFQVLRSGPSAAALRRPPPGSTGSQGAFSRLRAPALRAVTEGTGHGALVAAGPAAAPPAPALLLLPAAGTGFHETHQALSGRSLCPSAASRGGFPAGAARPGVPQEGFAPRCPGKRGRVELEES